VRGRVTASFCVHGDEHSVPIIIIIQLSLYVTNTFHTATNTQSQLVTDGSADPISTLESRQELAVPLILCFT
jgi:hypothetical protein